MNRRGFIGLFGGAVAALTLDPEKALWVPGKKLISIPKPAGFTIRVVIDNHGAFIKSLSGQYVEFPIPAGSRINFEIMGLTPFDFTGLYARRVSA